MGRRTDPAKIVTWIDKYIPHRIKIRELVDTIKEKIEEIILNNLSYGAEPISLSSVYQIFQYYKEIIYSKLDEQLVGPERVNLDLLKEVVDNEIRNAINDIRNKYYLT